MTIDPITEDPRPLEERELEQRREQDEFVLGELLRDNPFQGATAVLRQYLKRDEIVFVVEYDIKQYATEYGWPDTFRVLARAIEAYEDARRRG